MFGMWILLVTLAPLIPLSVKEFLQMEGSPYSIVDVEQSKARLVYLPYFQDVTVDTNPVR